MKELDYPLNFFWRTYWDFLKFPQKIWGLRAPPPIGPGTPPNASFGGPGPHMGWGPQTPNFFWEVQEVPIGPPEKIKWVVQLFHGFFESYVINQNRYRVNHRVKLQPTWWDSRVENVLKIFHLVKSLGPNEWENAREQCILGLLAQ